MDTSDASKSRADTKENVLSNSAKKRTPKSMKKTQPFCQPGASESAAVQPLPVVRYDKNSANIDSPSGKVKLANAPLIVEEDSAAMGSESRPDSGVCGSPAKGQSPKKLLKSSQTTNVRDINKLSAAESLPEVKVQASTRKGRVVPSRYKVSAKNRAAATPTKMSESSCISINQSKLFSTATSSTPVLAGGKMQDVSIRPKQPPKMASLDACNRQKPVARTAAANPASSGKADKGAPKPKKASKTATIKVKPLRTTDSAPKAQGDADRVSDHQLLYNQYLQWCYLRRMSEASIKREQPELSYQARQLSGLVDGTRQNCIELERKLQAVTLYREMAQLERQLTDVLGAINGSADAVRGDLSRMTTTLDATRNRLQLKAVVEPAGDGRLVEELVAAAERCRGALAALDAAVTPHASLLQHTAESVSSLQQALADGAEHMGSSAELVQELGSLALQEASLSLGATGPAGRTAHTT